MENYLFKCKFIYVVCLDKFAHIIDSYVQNIGLVPDKNFMCIGKHASSGGVSLCSINRRGMLFVHDLDGVCAKKRCRTMTVGGDFYAAAKRLDKLGVDFLNADICFYADGKYTICIGSAEIFNGKYTYSKLQTSWGDYAMVYAKYASATAVCDLMWRKGLFDIQIIEGRGKTDFRAYCMCRNVTGYVEGMLQEDKVTEELLRVTSGMFFHEPVLGSRDIRCSVNTAPAIPMQTKAILDWITEAACDGDFTNQAYKSTEFSNKWHALNDTVH